MYTAVDLIQYASNLQLYKFEIIGFDKFRPKFGRGKHFSDQNCNCFQKRPKINRQPCSIQYFKTLQWNKPSRACFTITRYSTAGTLLSYLLNLVGIIRKLGDIQYTAVLCTTLWVHVPPANPTCTVALIEFASSSLPAKIHQEKKSLSKKTRRYLIGNQIPY